MKYKLIAYAMDFASFLVQKIENGDKINNIILFGSVSRHESSENSDIDLFIDIAEENKKLEIQINNISNNFFRSAKYLNYWNLIGIKNEIKLSIGRLDKWKELKPSIAANGILLYGKFKPDVREGKHKIFFIWENIKPNSKRVLFNKQLFGYKIINKYYPGLLNKYNGERLGKGCIITPLEHSNIFHNLFKKYNITVKIKKVLDYA